MEQKPSTYALEATLDAEKHIREQMYALRRMFRDSGMDASQKAVNRIIASLASMTVEVREELASREA